MGDVTLEDGTTISYEVVGSGPPVVVCCGGPNTTYGYLVEDLATVARDFTLVFFDYRGSGRSSSSDPATYTFEQLGDDVGELAAALGYEHVGSDRAFDGRVPSAVEKLGIVVDSLQIQEIEDSTGFINNIDRAACRSGREQARIAATKADQEAAQREQEAAALRAQYVRDTEIKQAGFAAEVEQARRDPPRPDRWQKRRHHKR